ncbi:ABC transporter ATP-binding protein [Rhodoferax sp.]|uniref:ABC transporter ATP-binding protein n=1 Tax=Rhodoferax sp. TaxID=50421 RepID=UPI00276FB004|nr:ABC transporter ATP-binding protein [Rhodoferax sp.]
MSSDDAVIRVRALSKCYQIYDQSSDRLKQFLLPRLQRLVGQEPKCYFREFWSLRDIGFEVKRGETVGIIGRNGSGKSTLLQIICGTLHPTAGQVEVSGRVAALLELGSGFNPEFTGRENVYLNAGVLGLTRTQTAQRFADIEAFADIGQFIDQPVKTYSSGMLVRLAFAVIAHVDADILVIDEALAVGDAFFTQKCMRFLRQFMRSGTVLFVSHDTAAVTNLCSRAIWLEQGQIAQAGHPKEVSEQYLQAFYEAQQGKGTTTRLKTPNDQEASPALKDQRLEFINASNLRNDLQMFAFDPNASGFGQGGASIVGVRFLDSSGEPLSWVIGGELVSLQIDVECQRALASPIVGFTVKDRLGQGLFGDNTFLTYVDNPQPCEAGHCLSARFTFEMPRLAKGDYSVTVAVADGTQHEHVQHHWMHDALVFQSASTSVAAGLIGIPMRSVEMGVCLPVVQVVR